jgi:hypothetical protein
MLWRVGLIDSCGVMSGSVASAGFVLEDAVQRIPGRADPTGHGTRIATLLTRDHCNIELILAQVFVEPGATNAVVVGSAIDWCIAEGATLLHLSLGLANDRAPLAVAVSRAIDLGCVVVAATPARGAAVIRGTGDARCASGEISQLAAQTFGGCPRTDACAINSAGTLGGATLHAQGASIGAAHVTRLILQGAVKSPGEVIAAMAAMAQYWGPELRYI